MISKKVIFIIFLLVSGLLKATNPKIVWADRVLKSTDKYEHDNNHAGHAIGLPFLYQGMMYGVIDIFTDGYIIRTQDAVKKNSFKVSFGEKVMAQQIIIGGVLNLGTIQYIYAYNGMGKKKEIYQMQKGSVSKFHNFYTFFEPMEITAVEIVIDHQKVRDWNLIKGIGLTMHDAPVELLPDFYTEDEFFGKEKIHFNTRRDGCVSFNQKLWHDGKEVFFVKECFNKFGNQDIWYSKMKPDGTWELETKMPPPLNNEGHNFVSAVSPTGKFLLLGNTYKPDGSHLGDGVSISHRNPDGTWSMPKNITISGFNNYNDHANFFMNNEENIMLMAIEDENSMGDLDLYVSQKDPATGIWSKPQNLGPMVNTHFREDFPHLSPDGKHLYFSSTGYIGFGGEDIYVSKKIGASWTAWTKPQNLGPLVNTKSDDFGFTLSSSGNEAYFNAPDFDFDSIIQFDCYKVSLPKTLRYEPQVEITGFISSIIDTNKKLSASIHLKKFDGYSEYISNTDPVTGRFTIKVPAGYPYIVTIDNDNYFTKMENIFTLESGKDYKMSRNYYLMPLPDSGSIYTIKNLVFYKSLPILTPESGAVLDSIANVLKSMIGVKIEIAGHTDSKGDYNKNKKISFERAKEIACLLAEKGISPERMTFKGYGSDKPIANNETEKGREENRRIEIMFLTKVKKDDDDVQDGVKN